MGLYLNFYNICIVHRYVNLCLKINTFCIIRNTKFHGF